MDLSILLDTGHDDTNKLSIHRYFTIWNNFVMYCAKNSNDHSVTTTIHYELRAQYNSKLSDTVSHLVFDTYDDKMRFILEWS
jgi:hypothetical protein